MGVEQVVWFSRGAAGQAGGHGGGRWEAWFVQALAPATAEILPEEQATQPAIVFAVATTL